MQEITVNDAISEWDDGDHMMYDSLHEAPEIAWQAILEILKRNLTDDEKSMLAAGPLEDLLRLHGSTFIDRVEQEARRDPKFNHLLGGVWQSEMPLDIWERVQKSRNEVW